jgi:uncharacterized protein (DUF1697 family)
MPQAMSLLPSCIVETREHVQVVYVAFLRAINTGNRRIKMAELRSFYDDLGYTNVATHIASGNVIFEASSPPLPQGLESKFEDRFGFASEVFLRTAPELAAVVEAVPWKDGSALVEVSFLEREPDLHAAAVLEATANEPEALSVVGREVYLLRGRGAGMPTVHKESTSIRILDMKMTRRGMRTVRQIHDKHVLGRR